MTIMVSGRHVEVTDAMKDYAESKLQAILEDRHKITNATIVLDLQKTRHKAEVIVHGKNLNVEADSESYDMYGSIDDAMGKIDRQISRYFDKKQDHHKTHSSLPRISKDDTGNDYGYED
jgi:ribosome hibernation promoting factor